MLIADIRVRIVALAIAVGGSSGGRVMATGCAWVEGGGAGLGLMRGVCARQNVSVSVGAGEWVSEIGLCVCVCV